MTAPIVRAAWVNRTPEDAFRVFTEDIGAWWPLLSHGIFGERAGGVFFEDGRLVERSVSGEEVVWGEVQVWEAPSQLTFTWHPGRSEDDASIVDVAFERSGLGTRVVLEHRGWDAFGAEGLERRRQYVGPGAWGYVLDHFADSAEPRSDAADLSALTAAYDAFFVQAERGGFGEAPAGEWDAFQVLAHVALNDAAIVSVSQGLVHGNEVRFENAVCHDSDVLASWIDSCVDLEGLIKRGRVNAGLVVASLARLSTVQRETPVHCRLQHNGDIIVNDPRPWGVIACDVQAGVHLPAHVEQLRNLCITD